MFSNSEEYNAGRMYVMKHWDEYDKSFWQGIINALRSQGIREAKKKKSAKALVENFIKSKKD